MPIVFIALVVGASVGGPAHAQTAESYSGTATARALHLSLLGRDVTFGVANGSGGSTVSAAASAAGQLLAPATTTLANVARDNTSAADPSGGGQKCALGQLPQPIDSLLNLSLACSSSLAEIGNGLPHARGQGSVASLSLNASTLLKTVTAQLPLGSDLSSLLQPVLGALNQQTGQSLALDPTSTIADLLNALSTQQTLAVSLGKATSELTSAATNVTSTGAAQGATIDVLPVAALGNTPLLSITVGAAKATAVRDRAKATSSAVFDPALVTVHLGGIGALAPQTISIAPGQTITLLAGTPLESTITVANGHTEGTGSAMKAVADGVSLQLLKGLNLNLAGSGTQATNGGIALELAHAEAAVTGAPSAGGPTANPTANPTGPAPATPVEVKALALTGSSAWLPLAGLLLVAGAYLTRRIVVRS